MCVCVCMCLCVCCSTIWTSHWFSSFYFDAFFSRSFSDLVWFVFGFVFNLFGFFFVICRSLHFSPVTFISVHFNVQCLFSDAMHFHKSGTQTVFFTPLICNKCRCILNYWMHIARCNFSDQALELIRTNFFRKGFDQICRLSSRKFHSLVSLNALKVLAQGLKRLFQVYFIVFFSSHSHIENVLIHFHAPHTINAIYWIQSKTCTHQFNGNKWDCPR